LQVNGWTEEHHVKLSKSGSERQRSNGFSHVENRVSIYRDGIFAIVGLFARTRQRKK
jgi:hypothetical protein